MENIFGAFSKETCNTRICDIKGIHDIIFYFIALNLFLLNLSEYLRTQILRCVMMQNLFYFLNYEFISRLKSLFKCSFDIDIFCVNHDIINIKKSRN